MQAEVEGLLSADDATLYRHIGREVLALDLGVRARSDAENEREGRDWLRSRREHLQEVICSSNVARVYLASQSLHDRALLVAAITDLIATLVGGIGAFSVAVLIVREGLQTFCDRNRT